MTIAYEGETGDGLMSRAKSGVQQHLLEYYQPPGITGPGNLNQEWSDVPYKGEAFETIDRKKGYDRKGGYGGSWDLPDQVSEERMYSSWDTEWGLREGDTQPEGDYHFGTMRAPESE